MLAPLYPFPDVDVESKIIGARVPDVPPELQRQLVEFIHELRNLDLKKLPAISETIDWARTLILLHAEALEPQLVKDTLNVILKFQEDIDNVYSEVNTNGENRQVRNVNAQTTDAP